MRKIIALFMALMITVMPVSAHQIGKFLCSQHINSGDISISIKDVETGNVVYALNDRSPRNPASTLKLVTAFASYNTLGEDYKFSTKLYKTDKNELYIKLGADPFLTSDDLTTLIGIAKAKNIIEPKKIYIDNTIFDSVEWGEGWQWDDDLNPYMPKFSAYNIDGNLLNIEVTSNGKNMAPSIVTKPYYPITFMNMVNFGNYNNIKLERNNSIAPNIINATGTISTRQTVKIPINNIQLYFNLRLEDAIKASKLSYYSPIYVASLPEKSYFAGEVTHDINQVMNSVLIDSNNLSAETLFKVAGSEYSHETGTTENSLLMLNNFLTDLGINTSDIKIVDGSGVSKNNIMTADFMTEYLLKLSQKDNYDSLKEFMAVPGTGTLKNRMLYFKDNLVAKTGTLSDTSAIAGFIKSRSGKLYAFDIMIQGVRTSDADKKNIEEQILRILYTK